MARVAIVTGGASGIGRAVGAALARRGADVVLADVDGPGVEAAADELGARAAVVDVRDAAAVGDLVRSVHREAGRLDLLFNNAGIGLGGETEELTLAHWDRIIDVNVRGVVHGVHAAYPLMVAQGSGHIVNTASLAGLTPAPGLTAYAMTKHAVVGLSLSLRVEAAAKGVRVSVLCPGVVDTPILDSKGPEDLPVPPSAARTDGRAMLERAAGGAYPPERLAEDVLRGIARNDAVIVAPRRAEAAWRIHRLLPRVVERQLVRHIARERALRGDADPA